MVNIETKELYAGRRLFLCTPDMFGHVQYAVSEPNDVVLADPLMPAEQFIIIESSIPPEELHRLIFGPGDAP